MSKPASKRKAMDMDAREDQIIALAYDLAEKRIREGTASSQEVTHFLKLGSSKNRLEKQVLAEQVKLITAKTSAIETGKNLGELYANAVKAMQSYQGGAANEDEDPDLY